MNRASLDLLLAALPADALILDAGAWFRPEPRATHVVDLMPYETRGCRLQINPLPGECFSRNTWRQVDFVDPLLRLPFRDGLFAFSICTQTLEDLLDPRPLLRELRRVSRAGLIETPSRLAEQAMGARDRMTGAPGHPHHHWIVESPADGELIFYQKRESLEANPLSLVPHRWYESHIAANPDSSLCCCLWKNELSARFVEGSTARNRASAFAGSLRISWRDRWIDALLRAGRRAKSRWFHSEVSSDWWQEMLRLSAPYSNIPIS